MTDLTNLAKIDVLDVTQKAGEQFVSAVKQSQSLVLDAARTVADALPAVPAGVTDNPVVNALPDVQALTAYGFDFAAELLAAQKEFTLALASALAPKN